MIEKDRRLLARMTAVNTAMGEVVVAMLAHQDGGELNPADLREVGERLRQLGQDMRDRADEMARHPMIDNPWFEPKRCGELWSSHHVAPSRRDARRHGDV